MQSSSNSKPVLLERIFFQELQTLFFLLFSSMVEQNLSGLGRQIVSLQEEESIRMSTHNPYDADKMEPVLPEQTIRASSQNSHESDHQTLKKSSKANEVGDDRTEAKNRRLKSNRSDGGEAELRELLSPSSTHDDENAEGTKTKTGAMMMEKNNGRERLKRHRIEMSGRVWIPDIWGQEDSLKDWIDCTSFDASLRNSTIMSARAALVQEGRRTNSGRLRI